MRLKLTVEYDGTAFRGWARAARRAHGRGRAASARSGALYEPVRAASRWPGGRTRACTRSRTSSRSTSTAARRRDARPSALNAFLPPDVAVARVEQAPDDFHARFDARSRSYRYRVWRRRERSALEATRALWHPRPLDVEALRTRARSRCVGKHDFRAFTPTETQHSTFVRTVSSGAAGSRSTRTWSRSRSRRDSFLRHMVRTLVGTMLRRPGARCRSSTAARAPKRARRRRRTACTSRTSPY